MDTMTNTKVILNTKSRQYADICHKFLTEPWEKYHCGYKLKKTLENVSEFHSIRTSLIPEYKDESEISAIKKIVCSVLEFQKCINKLIFRYPSIRTLISGSSPKSETDVYSLTENDPLLTVQRIDYIVDQNSQIKVIDPNILPLGLGLFSLRDDMLHNHLEELSKITAIDIPFCHQLARFDLSAVANMLIEWLKLNHYPSDNPIHLITEKNYNHNLDHECVCREVNKHNISLKITYIEDLDLNRVHKTLINKKTKEVIKFAWRYGRFPSPEQMTPGWANLFEAINQNYLYVINKPGIYALENKIFLSLLSLTGFSKLLDTIDGNSSVYELINFIPDSFLIRVNRATRKVSRALSINTKAELTWTDYDLTKLPRSYVFKTADTSGSKGVRLVLNESNAKGQRYFWEFVEMFSAVDIFIISNFIRPKKRTVVDPISSSFSPEEFIFKDHVYFTSNNNSFKLIGFSAFARKDNYKVHGSQETVSVVQFHRNHEDSR